MSISRAMVPVHPAGSTTQRLCVSSISPPCRRPVFDERARACEGRTVRPAHCTNPYALHARAPIDVLEIARPRSTFRRPDVWRRQN